MKTAEFEQFIRMGAVDTVVIFDRTDWGEGYEVYTYRKGFLTFEQEQLTAEVERAGNSIEAARGGRRVWKDLDRAYAFIRGAGWKGMVEIDKHAKPEK
jgi:hypothetical protein